MYVRNKKAWHRLIYDLLYPALLGSMLYNIFSPSTVSWNYVGQVVVVCIYLVDYLYLYTDWMDQGYPNRLLEVFGDGLVAILYRLSFGFIAARPTLASICLGLVFFLYLFYEIAQHRVTRIFILASVFVMLLNILFNFLSDNNQQKTFVVAAFIEFLLLAFFVFYYAPKQITPREPDVESLPSESADAYDAANPDR